MTMDKLPGKSRSFRAIVACACLCFAYVFLLVACGNTVTEIGIDDGVLDLGGWDTEAIPIVICAGNWKFSWNENHAVYASPEYDDSSWDTIAVPDTWQAKTGTPDGYGWYRLTIRNNCRKNLGLYIKNSNTAYSLFINGEMLASMGRPGMDAASSVPGTMPQLVSLPDAKEYTVAVFNSNFDDINGGLTTAPQLGEVTILADTIKNAGIIDAFILGIFFIITVYFSIVWLLRREDRTSLFFALFCLTNFLRMLTFSYSFCSLFHPFDIFDIRMRFQYLSLAPGAVFFLMFLSTLFPVEFRTRFYGILKTAAILLALFTLVTPVSVFTRFLNLYQAVLIVTGIGVIISLVVAAGRKEKGAAIVLTGFVAMFLTLINDFIGAILGSYDLGLEQYALVFFVIIQSVMLATRSAQAFRTSEHLSMNLQGEIKRQTERIEIQNKDLMQLHEERTNFFINFLHETKTPLTNIRNYLERYLRRNGMTDDARIIMNNMEKLSRDMTNLFDLEKLNKGFEYYDHGTPVDCSSFTREKVKLFEETACLRRVSIRHTIADNVFVNIDPNALDRIMNNLIDNAVRYNRPEGSVSVSLAQKDAGVSFSVTNTGPPIPGDRIEHIFKPYYQITRAKQNLQGIGVGLSIVKKILDGLGAAITVSSSAESGTTFSILFPAPADTNTVIAGVKPSIPIAIPGESALLDEEYRDDRYTILIVEDNGETLAFLQQSLYARFNVFTAANGKIALRKIRTIPKPHLVISDIMMDETDGYALYDALAREESFSDIPFIFITAKSTQEEKLAGLNKGAIHYITKPFDIGEVTAAIESLLEFLRKKIEKEKRLIREKVLGKISAADAREAARMPGGRVLLSYRERQITAFIVKGYQNKEISDCLEISTRTVDKHIENIYKKFNVQNRVELVRIMFKSESPLYT